MVTTTRIYQASDLAGSERTHFIDAGRAGCALLRTKEGESLSLVPSATLEHLSAMRDYALAYLLLDSALSRPRNQRRDTDFGAWAFIAVYDDDDIETFRAEVNDALAKVAGGVPTSAVERLVDEWRKGASVMSDPLARSILEGTASDDDWVDAEPPLGEFTNSAGA